MQQACCDGVLRSPEGLRGTTEKWGTTETYVTKPDGEAKAAVIVVHDIFGLAVPNTKFIVDHLATEGFHAAMVDLYEGAAYPASKLNHVIAGDSDFTNWAANWFNPAAFEKVKSTLSKYVEHLHSLGFSKVGIIGFCYGGSVSVKVASTGLVQATVSLHGGRHTTEELAEAKCPILYLVAKGDSAFPDVDNVQAVLKEHPEKGSMKIFEGVFHGWVNRGSYDDETVKHKADEAMADTVAYLKKHLL